MSFRYLRLSLVCALLSACSSFAPPCPAPVSDHVVYVVGQGWHVEIGIPVDELDDKLAFYKKTFPSARALMFGYGKKTFFIAPAHSLSEYILGPVPGPGAIQVIGLSVLPDEAYPGEGVVTLAIDDNGEKTLSDFIWNDLAKDDAGNPMELAESANPEGLFYAANSEYSYFHTCNTWVVDALNAAGLQIDGDGVTFAGQAMSRVQSVAAGQCAEVQQ